MWCDPLAEGGNKNNFGGGRPSLSPRHKMWCNKKKRKGEGGGKVISALMGGKGKEKRKIGRLKLPPPKRKKNESAPLMTVKSREGERTHTGSVISPPLYLVDFLPFFIFIFRNSCVGGSLQCHEPLLPRDWKTIPQLMSRGEEGLGIEILLQPR